MKRAYLFSSLGVAGLVAGTGAVWQSVDRQLVDRSYVGEVAVGGLKRDDAAKKLRVWWETEKLKPLTLKLKNKEIRTATPSELGIRLDDVATIAQVGEDGGVTQAIGGTDASEARHALIFATTKIDTKPFVKAVDAVLPAAKPARVKFVKGAIVRTKETPRQALDTNELPLRAIEALKMGKDALQVPLVEAPKKITDEMLANVTDVLATFSTRFSAGNRPRSGNIRLAAAKLDGILVAPGETISYNETVGQRTRRAGFQEAGVYLNGRHDTGIGGGICQVSTTLYNAALFANLKIVSRQNHSLPVPYVPLGRDATVDWGNIDLVLENDTEDPIVIVSNYTPGKLTFRVLGKKRQNFDVSVVGSGISYGRAGRGTRRVIDRKLAPGTSRVIAAASALRTTSTTRIVKVDGVVVKREALGRSRYGGGPTIVGYNPAPRRRIVRRPSAPRTVAPTAPVATETGTPGVVIEE